MAHNNKRKKVFDADINIRITTQQEEWLYLISEHQEKTRGEIIREEIDRIIMEFRSCINKKSRSPKRNLL